MSQAKWSASRPMTLGILALLTLVGGFGAWSIKSQIAGAIVASGQIEVEQNRKVVQHPDGGVVAEIIAEEGDLVEEGDVLVTLDRTLLASEHAIVESQLFELMARRGRLEAERDNEDAPEFAPEILAQAELNMDVADQIDGQVRLFAARNNSMQQEIDQLKKRRSQIADQIVGIEAQLDSLATQVDLLQTELEAQQSLLDRGLAQMGRVLDLQREDARMQGSIGELVAQRAQAEGRITEIDIEMIKLSAQRREEAISRLRDLQFQELELAEQRRSLNERLSRLEIRAPESGIVYGMQIFAKRSVIRPADPVLFLVPQDKPLVIMAQVDPVHIDELFVNQEVVLRFSALDARTTPELFGAVQKISADAFQDENSPISYYRVEIQLNEGEQARLPEGTILIPGMPVEAFIQTSARSPMEYLVKPLADYFARAFRES